MVPAGLLSFIYQMTFRYGVRSIQHLIGLLGNTVSKQNGDGEKVVENGVLKIARLNSKFKDVETIGKEGLVYHLIHPDHAAGIKEKWDESFRDGPRMVPVWCKAFDKFGRPTRWMEDQHVGSCAFQMVGELGGTIKHEEFVDVTPWAGIEPFHITQLWLSEQLGEWNHGMHMRHVFFRPKHAAATSIGGSPSFGSKICRW